MVETWYPVTVPQFLTVKALETILIECAKAVCVFMLFFSRKFSLNFRPGETVLS